jgi:hypothetical protein
MFQVIGIMYVRFCSAISDSYVRLLCFSMEVVYNKFFYWPLNP